MCFLWAGAFTKTPGDWASAFPDSISCLRQAAAVLGLLGFLQQPRVVGSAGLEYLV
jgi:hypothetical protein